MNNSINFTLKDFYYLSEDGEYVMCKESDAGLVRQREPQVRCINGQLINETSKTRVHSR